MSEQEKKSASGTGTGTGPSKGHVMRCHYDVMELDRTATADEIKKQYKRLALKYHPDRNHGMEEWATDQFKLLTAANSVLSDAQERQWYDDHRESILRGKSGASGASGGGEAGDGDDENVVNLWPYFSRAAFEGYADDDEQGFYGVYNALFEQLIDQEPTTNKAKQATPRFGASQTPFSEVTAFYAFWSDYTTAMSFAWHDKYDVTEAENRNVRRAAEKENQKYRDMGRKEYVNLVRSLVAFVKKRDPRVVQMELRRVEQAKLDEQRRAELRAQAAVKRKEERERSRQLYENDAEERARREEERAGAYLIADSESEEEDSDDSGSESDSEEGEAFSDDGSAAAAEEALGGLTLQSSKQKETTNTTHNSKSAKKGKGKCKVTMHGYDSDIAEQEERLQDFLKAQQSSSGGKKGKKSKGGTSKRLQTVNSFSDDDDDDAAAGAEEKGLLVCEACGKEFKSSSQMQQHISSRAHRNRVNELEKKKNTKAQKGNTNNSNNSQPNSTAASAASTNNVAASPASTLGDQYYASSGDDDDEDKEEEEKEAPPVAKSGKRNKKSRRLEKEAKARAKDLKQDIFEDQISDDDRDDFEASNVECSVSTPLGYSESGTSSTVAAGKGKAKKSLANANTGSKDNNSESEWVCRDCGLVAESRNKLFAHLQSTGHAIVTCPPSSSVATSKAKEKASSKSAKAAKASVTASSASIGGSSKAFQKHFALVDSDDEVLEKSSVAPVSVPEDNEGDGKKKTKKKKIGLR